MPNQKSRSHPFISLNWSNTSVKDCAYGLFCKRWCSWPKFLGVPIYEHWLPKIFLCISRTLLTRIIQLIICTCLKRPSSNWQWASSMSQDKTCLPSISGDGRTEANVCFSKHSRIILEWYSLKTVREIHSNCIIIQRWLAGELKKERIQKTEKSKKIETVNRQEMGLKHKYSKDVLANIQLEYLMYLSDLEVMERFKICFTILFEYHYNVSGQLKIHMRKPQLSEINLSPICSCCTFWKGTWLYNSN